MKVCIIGACGHSKQAYKYLKTRSDTELCGIARGSEYEASPDSFDTSMPLYDDYTEMLDSIHPDLAIVSPVFGRTGKVIIDCAKRGINVFAEKAGYAFALCTISDTLRRFIMLQGWSKTVR